MKDVKKMLDADMAKELEKEKPLPKDVKRKDREIFTMSFRMSMETARELKKAADEHNTTIQFVVANAVDEWMKRNTAGRFFYPKKERGKKQEG